MTGPEDPLALRSWTVGDIVVGLVPETTLPAETGAWLLPDADPELVAGVDWLGDPWTDPEGQLRLASHSFTLEVDGQRMLVDAGVGNSKPRKNSAFDHLDTDYLDRLSSGGVTPEDVDLVLLTHLHTDHVGWLTRWEGEQWVPTFPRARHVTSRTEWDYWAQADVEPERRQMLDDSVLPVEQAGLMAPAVVPPGGLDVARGVRLVPTPGHTPGHVSVQITSRGQTALITGDAVHHPVQVAFPGICSCVDVDPAHAVRTREALLAEAQDAGALLLGTHFPAPVAARIDSADGAYRLVPRDGNTPSPS